LLTAFNTFLNEGFPEALSTGVVHALFKGGNASEFDNYRGITVGPVLAKLFAVILDARLSDFAEGRGLRANGQAGFRKDHRTTDQLFILRTVVEQSKAKKKPLYCCFVDFKKAFDTVPREMLWQVLAGLGVGGKFLQCLQSMYAKDTVRVNHPTEGLSSSFRCQQGVKQGCPLSPLLFGLYLDALEGRLDGKECGAPALAGWHVWLLLFADDLTLMSETEVGLQQQLDVLQKFCDERGLVVNVAKTKVLVFNTPVTTACRDFMFRGNPIERVQSFKYLGILFQATKNLDSAVERLVAASKRSLFAMNRRCAELRIANVKMRVILFDTLVRSVASYACEVWVDSKSIEAAEVVYRGFLKTLLGVRGTTSSQLVLGEFGKFPFAHFAWGQALAYYNRLCGVSEHRLLSKAWQAQLGMLAAGSKCWAKSMHGWLLENRGEGIVVVNSDGGTAGMMGSGLGTEGGASPAVGGRPTALADALARPRAGLLDWAAFQREWLAEHQNVTWSDLVADMEDLAASQQSRPWRMGERGDAVRRVTSVGVEVPRRVLVAEELDVVEMRESMRVRYIESFFSTLQSSGDAKSSVLLRYLLFKNGAYECESYLESIECVQLRKVLARFRCGNSDLEVVLGARKKTVVAASLELIPCAQRLCRFCSLGAVDTEDHFLLVCPALQQVRDRFSFSLNITAISTLAELMQTNKCCALARYVASCQDCRGHQSPT
jgi:hypothetical protein